MTVIEINFTSTLADQFEKVGRKRHKYKFIDCTKAVLGLEELGNVEWMEMMQRIAYHSSVFKPDLIVTPLEFNEYELAEITGKKGIVVHLG
jgi:hypothetical protein